MHIAIQRTVKEDAAFHGLISMPIFLNSLGLMSSTSRSALETAKNSGRQITTTSTDMGTSFLYIIVSMFGKKRPLPKLTPFPIIEYRFFFLSLSALPRSS
jgi:hypothetical protein